MGDIAIFKLSVPVAESDMIKYAVLPAAGFTPATGQELVTAG